MGAGTVNRTRRPADNCVRNRVRAGFRGMDDTTDITKIDVDELWLREWVDEGLNRLEEYLARHAAFDGFLRTRAER